MNQNINFNSLSCSLEDYTDILDSAGTIENLGFTKDQVRFINLLIESALKRYHEQLFNTFE